MILSKMISVLDTKTQNDQKENFYRGLLLGLLRSEPTWLILSNAESGEGFSDILIEPEDLAAGIVIEVKYAVSLAGLDESCKKRWNRLKCAIMMKNCEMTAERIFLDMELHSVRSGVKWYARSYRYLLQHLETLVWQQNDVFYRNRSGVTSLEGKITDSVWVNKFKIENIFIHKFDNVTSVGLLLTLVMVFAF